MYTKYQEAQALTSPPINICSSVASQDAVTNPHNWYSPINEHLLRTHKLSQLCCL